MPEAGRHQHARRAAMGQRALLAIASAMTFAVASCGSAPSPTPAIRTIDTTGQECAGVGLADATLHGSPTDPRVVWLEPGPGDLSVVFPTGFTARFVPSLEVLNASGSVVLREGDRIEGACVGPGESLLIGWP